MNFRKHISLLLTLMFVSTCYADLAIIVRNYSAKYYQVKIETLINKIDHSECSSCNHDMSSRVKKISSYFLGKPYLLGAAGEGKTGRFDQSPLFRTDAFDCVTFVNTVLALAKSHSYSQFLTNYKQLNYKQAKVSFIKRYHFIELGWNANAQKLGYVEDITKKISPNYSIAYTLIDEPNWWNSLSSLTLKHVSPLTLSQQEILLTALHRHARETKAKFTRMMYIPLTMLFVARGNHLMANYEILHSLPNVALVEVINKNKDFKKLIGTNLSVMHLGFIQRTPQGLVLRHASQQLGKVVDIDFEQYFRQLYLTSCNPNNIGINIQTLK